MPDDQNNPAINPLYADWARKAAGNAGPWGDVGGAMPEVYGAGSPIQDMAVRGVAGAATLPQRLGEAVQEANENYYGPGPKTMSTDELPFEMRDRSPGLSAEAAMAVMGGAGAVPSEAGALQAGMRIPEGYYSKIPQEMRLSRQGISHPGYRWEVYDPQTGNVMRKDLATKSGANMSKDRLDNSYGGYRYRVRPVRAQKLTEAEEKILKDKGIDLDAPEEGSTEFRAGMKRLPARNNPITGKLQVAPQQKLTDLFIEGGPPVDVAPKAALRGKSGKFSTIADYYRGRVPSQEELTPIQANPMYDPANPPAPVTSRLESPSPQDPASVERNLSKLPNSFTLGSGATDNRLSPAMQAAAQSVQGTKPSNFWGDTLKTLRGFQQDKAPIVDKFKQEAHGINNPPPSPGSLEAMMGKVMGKSNEDMAASSEAGSLPNMMQRTLDRTKGPASLPVSPVERNAAKMPNSFMQGAGAAAPIGAMAGGGQDQGSPQLSPGVVKFLMGFLKANPDLAQEMSTRMQAVINGKQIQGQQPPQGPVNGP